jgi:hypothetical protein
LNAETLEFLAYSSNRLVRCHPTAMMMQWHLALETAYVVCPQRCDHAIHGSQWRRR